jgi:hypothetical protein
MNRSPRAYALLVFTFALILAGCTSDTAPPQSAEAKIQAALDKLEPADRTLAQAQKWCAVETENPLGKMGKPYKVMIKEQPVFLCCKSCEKEALAEPEKTLATAVELKAKASAAK